ncbi:hypothetical protein I4F81_000177 [Pyropia yezoensis]|uniref:Uncharacterized protein n=1 Tax=Pyropia yezoensis TaxID=2788 RepID=A0ACC3BI31_PYRYE|nr:hypothetical protein I4F81_000177 [Neopyropia yezoensis]
MIPYRSTTAVWSAPRPLLSARPSPRPCPPPLCWGNDGTHGRPGSLPLPARRPLPTRDPLCGGGGGANFFSVLAVAVPSAGAPPRKLCRASDHSGLMPPVGATRVAARL